MALRFSFLRFALVVAAATLLCVPLGLAQEPPQPKLPDPQAPTAPPVEPPAKLPKPQRGDRAQNLDFLFGALKAAPDAETAKAIEERIWALWFASGSDTADLLMTRIKTAVEAKELDLAIQLLDAVVEIKPDYVEAWNRRATVHFLKKDYGASLSDIRQVLAREPRHFGALSGLGLIMQELGEEKRALEVFRRAIELHPHIERIPDLVKSLIEKVEGRDI
jgi:tetratricopeptide (TPR) repeat protein